MTWGKRWDAGRWREEAALRARWKPAPAIQRVSEGEHESNAAPASAGCRPIVDAPVFPLVNACQRYGLPLPVPEYQFHPGRRWRFDYAFPLHMVAVEIEGGAWTNGRHTRGKGFVADLEKYNAAALLGWQLLRYTPDQISEAIRDLRLALKAPL